uniref:Neuroligin-1 n=1 Tax=Ascaris suum TaxID=6253 RepID=F1LG01_ASCSU
MLSVTVAVGCGLLFLNICIGFGLYRQCNKREESKKKLQLQYQTYVANHQPGGDINYNLNSSMNQQEPLLSSNNKGPTVPVRPGVSPTCPRHGRAAMALASGRNNTMGAPNSGPTLEEIQV